MGTEPIDGNGYMFIFVGVDSHNYPNGIDMCDVDHSCLLVFRAEQQPPVGRAGMTAMRRPTARLL
jgi:hypothetical protein